MPARRFVPASWARHFNFNEQGSPWMAKGQVRSNREARKPKQENAPAKVQASFANQIKDASKSSLQGGKHKN